MKQRKLRSFWCLLFLVILAGCGQTEEDRDAANALKAQDAQMAEAPTVGLILTSQDAAENEELIQQFEAMAGEQGVELLVRIPEVSWEDAIEAGNLTEDFVLCEVNPIEYQMLYVNEMVAEDVDVIAIHANHPQALEPVLTAARSVGIQICAFEQEIGEESRDVYVAADNAAEAVTELLNKEQFDTVS